MHHDTKFVALKIDAIVTKPKSVERLPMPLQFSEMLKVCGQDFLRQAAKLSQNVELQILGHLAEFSSTRGIKDDLEQRHAILVARTGIAPVFQP